MAETTFKQRFGVIPVRRTTHGDLEVLLVRTKADRWIMPKGKAEAGEDACAAAVRECREESGTSGTVLAGPEVVLLQRIPPEFGNEAAQRIVTFVMQVEHQADDYEHERDATWFDFDGAKRALGERRSDTVATALAAMIDWAGEATPGGAAR